MKPGPLLDTKLRAWLAACRDLPLEATDPAYIDLDGLNVRGHQHRRLLLQDTIEMAGDRSTCQLFTGFRGTGKSTELIRLRESLTARNYIVLLADATKFHALSRDLAIEEILPVIAGAFGSAASDHLGGESVLDAGWWDRFSAFLKKEVNLEPTMHLGPVELKAALRGEDAFLTTLRRSMAGRLDALAGQAHTFVAALVQRLRARAPGALGVVFLFDNLEKLSGPVHQFRDRIESVARVFGDHTRYLRLPGCHTVNTVPLYLQTIYPEVSEYYDGGRMPVLSTVWLTEQDPSRTPHRDGIAALRAVLAARITLGEAFASDDQIERVLLASGGHLRGLLKLVTDLLLRARHVGVPFTDGDVEAAIQDSFEDRRSAVLADAISLLDGIRRSFALDHITGEDVPRLARYLESNLVLCYRNGGGWYDLHPAIREHVRRLAQEARGA
ncbi:MAG: AAA family ATPase [Deltaproteobacteria bacterium]|nr:AAA family ATPase [Deltaproteobacteria bacterium]